MGVTDYLTWLLRNLYEGQETTVRILYKTPDWFRIEKGVPQGSLLSPCFFNLYAEHIMRNSGMDELQTGIKIGRRNINNLRYVCESESEVAQSCPTLSDLMDCSLPGCSIHGIFQARVLNGLPLPSPCVNYISSVSHSVVSDSLRPHELQHVRPPCPSQTPGVHSDSCKLGNIQY